MMAPSPLTRTLPTLVVAVLALLPAACSGEDDGWTDIQEEPQQQEHQWFVEPEQFDQLVFQNAQSVKGQQQEFETKLNFTMELLDQSCELSDEQKLKIRLAGEMEIQRFFIRYQKVKQFYIETKPDQNDVNEMWQMIQPLQRTAQAGLFGEGSLVKRVTRETLAENQLRVHRRVEKEQRDFRYRALVEMYVMMLDEHVPLTATQRDGLLELLMENTRPPNVFGQTDQYYILHQVSTVPRHDLEEVFDGPVGEAVWTALQMGKGYKGHLESQGVHPYVEEVE